MRTLSEIRINVLKSTREETLNTTLANEFINNTLMEINDPAWATGGHTHNWTFNRRKYTLTTVADTEFYVLPRDLDRVGLIRQTDSPIKLTQVPDNIFYRLIPNPTATGNPSYYRLWEEEGLSTRLDADDTIDIVSSSTSDTTQTVTVTGYDTNGIKYSEEYSLNGTTTVSGTTTFDAGNPIKVSKSAVTVGNITVTENSGGSTLVVVGKEERSPRFKVIGLYPIPGSAISVYIEYYTRIRRIVNEADVPDIDNKWIWIVRAGGLAKIYQYQNKLEDYLAAQKVYKEGVKSMVKADLTNPDYMPILRRSGLLRDSVPFINRWYDYNAT